MWGEYFLRGVKKYHPTQKIPNGEIVVKKISGQNFTAKIHPKIPGINLPEKKQPPKIPIPKKEVTCGISKIQCIILRETSNLGHFRPKGPAWANLGNPAGHISPLLTSYSGPCTTRKSDLISARLVIYYF